MTGDNQKMNKRFQYLFLFLTGLIFSALTWVNIYLFRPAGLANISKYFWIPFSLAVGVCLGLLLLMSYSRGWLLLSKKGKLMVAFSILGMTVLLLSLSEFNYQKIFPNSFSETMLQLEAINPGQGDEIVIDEIRADQRIINWKRVCQISGTFHWGDYSELTLVNDVTPGSIQCPVYPYNSVQVILKDHSQQENLKVSLDDQNMAWKIRPYDDKLILNVTLPMSLKMVVPNLMIGINTLILVLIIVLLWVGFLPASLNHQETPSSLPYLVWLVSGYLVCYGVCFLIPMVLNERIGIGFPVNLGKPAAIFANDFHFVMDNTRAVLVERKTMEWSVSSPGSYYFMLPLALMDFDSAYKIFTLIKIGLFIATTFFFPVFAILKKEYSLPLFFLLTGLASYWLQYDIWDGQFYPLIYSFVMIAIWLFQRHYTNRLLRYLSYFLITIAIQIKLSPVIFVIFFIRNWPDIKGNLKRVLLLGIVNLLLVFSTGLPNAQAFLNTILHLSQMGGPQSGPENHSIQSFITYLRLETMTDLTYPRYALTGIVVVCLVLLLWRFGRLKMKGANDFIEPFLLIGLTLGALLLPNENNDYTLPVLALILSVGFSFDLSSSNRQTSAVDLLIIAMLYSLTTFSRELKPAMILFQNNCIPLVVMLVYVTLIAYKNDIFLDKIQPPKLKKAISSLER